MLKGIFFFVKDGVFYYLVLGRFSELQYSFKELGVYFIIVFYDTEEIYF